MLLVLNNRAPIFSNQIIATVLLLDRYQPKKVLTPPPGGWGGGGVNLKEIDWTSNGMPPLSGFDDVTLPDIFSS